MTQQATLTILGCGNSTGVPAIGNYWGACDTSEPKNARTRSSALIQSNTTTLVIDTGPDFRQQLNRENISKIDAVLYTHQHSDHTAGIDELRVLKHRNKMKLIPIYGNIETLQDLKHRFYYVFDGGNHALYPPLIKPHQITPETFGHTMSIGDINLIPFEQDHGSCLSLGYRFGDTAYSVDILTLNDAAVETLKGVNNWIVDCAAYHNDNNEVHASLNTIYALNDKIGAKNVFLTSLSLAMDYKTLCDELPEGYIPCYDGLRIKVKQ